MKNGHFHSKNVVKIVNDIENSKNVLYISQFSVKNSLAVGKY